MKKSPLSLRILGVACTLLLAVGFVSRSGAEPVIGDGDRLGDDASGLKIGAAATPTAGDTLEAAKAKSKKYSKTTKKFKQPKTPKQPKVPKAPKATKQKKQKKQKSSKGTSGGGGFGGDDDDGR